MARVFNPDTIDDDKSIISLYIAFKMEKIDDLIDELKQIRENSSDDDYIVIEDDEERFRLMIRFCEGQVE